jgi:hypothetical protein
MTEIGSPFKRTMKKTTSDTIKSVTIICRSRWIRNVRIASSTLRWSKDRVAEIFFHHPAV